VRYRNGESRLLSLKSLFNDASGILDLDGTPPERVPVVRLLVCIVQSVFNPPEDSEEWEGYASVWEAAILPYLSRPGIHQHFELFGEGERFLQVRIGQDRDPVPMSKLFFHLASGNNATLFD